MRCYSRALCPVFFCPNIGTRKHLWCHSHCIFLSQLYSATREGNFFPSPVQCFNLSISEHWLINSNAFAQVLVINMPYINEKYNASTNMKFDLYFLQTMSYVFYPTQSGLVDDNLSIPIWWDQSLYKIDWTAKWMLAGSILIIAMAWATIVNYAIWR